MKADPSSHIGDARRRRGMTLAEVAISAVVVGIMLCAALTTLGASATARRLNADRSRGALLGEALMTEILNQPYREPQDVSNTFGPETGETGGGNRAAFDDVDDYDALTDEPPAQTDGTAIPGFDNWKRNVTAAWIQPEDTTQTSVTESGAKRLTLATSIGVRQRSSLVAVRTWCNSPPQVTANVSSGAALGEKVLVTLGNAVECDATDSFDPDGDTLTCLWAFGDGHIATGDSLSYTYQARGLYTLRLTAYDGRGGADYDIRQIVVQE